MANLREQSIWETGVYQIEENDPVHGGANGITNRPIKQLANRTVWLKNELASSVQAINANLTSLSTNKADKTLNLAAGNGLTGGGTLQANRTLTLGTPSQITASTTNSVTATSHTHAIDKASTTTQGIVQLNDTLASTATDQALTANQGKVLNDKITATDAKADTKANQATTITAGNGLTGGGTLQANRTLTLGTPSQITASTTNSVTATSHTHAIDKASTTTQGIVQLHDGLASNATNLALTANQGKVLDGKKLDKTALKFIRSLVARGLADVNLDLTKRSSIEAYFGNNWVADGVMQAVFHNSKSNHVFTGLPLDNQKGAIQLTFYSMGGYSIIECYYMVLNRFFRTMVNFNNENLTLDWKEFANESGNVATATKLQTARNIAMTGDGSWSVNFDGSANASGAFTLANSGVTAGSYNSVTVDAKGRVTRGLSQVHGLITATTATGTANQATTNTNTYLNIVASGVGQTASVGSSTQITGTNGITISSDTAGKLIVTRDSNSPTATKLQTARNIALTGAVTGNVNFDGSANVSIATILQNFSYQKIGDFEIRKHPDGTMIQTCIIKNIPNTNNGTSGTEKTFPIAFLEEPIITATLKWGYTNGVLPIDTWLTITAPAHNNVANNINAGFKVWLYEDQGVNNSARENYHVHIIAIGRWK